MSVTNSLRVRALTSGEFAALPIKEEQTLYFVTDTRTLYKGAVPYSGGGGDGSTTVAGSQVVVFSNAVLDKDSTDLLIL